VLTEHVPLATDDVHLTTAGRSNPPLNIFDSPEALIEPWAHISTHCDLANVRHKVGEVETKMVADRKADGELPSIDCHLEAILEIKVIVVDETHIMPSCNVKATIPHSRGPTTACSADNSDARVCGRDCRRIGSIINHYKLEILKRLRENGIYGLG
jgi:hypothetical protein